MVSGLVFPREIYFLKRPGVRQCDDGGQATEGQEMKLTFIREPWAVACAEQQQKGGLGIPSCVVSVFLCEDLEPSVGLADEAKVLGESTAL